MPKKINLAVIFGGKSGEHEVSLSSAISVIKTLDKNKYNIIPIAITKKGNWLLGDMGEKYMKLHDKQAGKENGISINESQSLVTISDEEKSLSKYAEGNMGGEKIDLIFPILHGPFGEDGRIQGMLDMLGVPYVFSGVLAHAIAMNKKQANIIAKNAGLNVAQNIIISQGESYDLNFIINKLSMPIVVKPVELGSSVGISINKSKEDLKKGIDEAFKYGGEIMLEKYIKGRELTVTVMGNTKNSKALAVTEIIPVISEFYDYKAKYEDGGSKHVCPAKIPEEIKEKIFDYAVNVFKAIGCKDLARADFILEEGSGRLYFIDLNTIPGMTKTSLAPEAAKEAGMEFKDFLDRLIKDNISKS